MNTQIIEFSYLIAAICFIFALKGLSSPKTARGGSLIGIAGMVIALVATFNLPGFLHLIPLVITIAAGGIVGTVIARKIAMTAIPQLVAGFHSFVGLAAVLVAYSALLAPYNFSIGIAGSLPVGALIEMSIGAGVGAITFSGSIIAFGKLQGLIRTKPIKFIGQQYVCLFIMLAIIFLIYKFTKSESILLFTILVALSLIIGVLLIIPIGGADMPVVGAMLNSY